MNREMKTLSLRMWEISLNLNYADYPEFPLIKSLHFPVVSVCGAELCEVRRVLGNLKDSWSNSRGLIFVFLKYNQSYMVPMIKILSSDLKWFFV